MPLTIKSNEEFHHVQLQTSQQHWDDYVFIILNSHPLYHLEGLYKTSGTLVYNTEKHAFFSDMEPPVRTIKRFIIYFYKNF